MIHPSKRQGQIWQAALVSQDISVIWEASDLDLAQMMVHMRQAELATPDLLLLDVGVLNSNPYAFCRWCREHYPDQKIVLTNANQKEISPPERQWAIYQGAYDLLPGFQRETLLTGVTAAVTRVLEILEGPPLRQEPLIQVLFSLTTFQGSVKSRPSSPPTPEPAPAASTGLFARKPIPQDLTPTTDTPPPIPPAPLQSLSANLKKVEPAPPSKPVPPQPESTPGATPKKRVYRGISY